MIFLDANFLINFYVQSNKEHDRAVEIFNKIKNQDLIISKSVIAETIGILNVRLKQNKDKLYKVYNKLNRDFKVVLDNGFHDKAFEKIMESDERLPFFDCIYLALMEELEIKEIASFDDHFDNIKGLKRIY